MISQQQNLTMNVARPVSWIDNIFVISVLNPMVHDGIFYKLLLVWLLI